MTRDKLLFSICPMDMKYDCCNAGSNLNCDYCNRLLSKWLDEYDKQIRAEAINDYYNTLNKKINTDTRLKETIREIHDNVAKEMYCKGIDDFANYLVEQGILGNRCISDGEITDYGKVYAKKYKEQLKVGGENEN